MGVSIRKRVGITVEAEHRDGICELCGIQMEQEIIIRDGEEEVIGMRCGKCGGRSGRLVARSVSIQEPDAPRCMKPKCLWYFFTQIMFSGLLSTYHRKRVDYAEKRRHRVIPMKYRTGDEAPGNIKQAIWGIIKVSIRR